MSCGSGVVSVVCKLFCVCLFSLSISLYFYSFIVCISSSVCSAVLLLQVVCILLCLAISYVLLFIVLYYAFYFWFLFCLGADYGACLLVLSFSTYKNLVLSFVVVYVSMRLALSGSTTASWLGLYYLGLFCFSDSRLVALLVPLFGLCIKIL